MKSVISSFYKLPQKSTRFDLLSISSHSLKLPWNPKTKWFNSKCKDAFVFLLSIASQARLKEAVIFSVSPWVLHTFTTYYFLVEKSLLKWTIQKAQLPKTSISLKNIVHFACTRVPKYISNSVWGIFGFFHEK
jgi:hypothetical protein